MIFCAAMRDTATLMRGDPMQFQICCLTGGGEVIASYIPPEGSTITAYVPKAGNSKQLISSTDISVVNQYGHMQVDFTKEQTSQMPLGQADLVMIVERDDYRHTFKTQLPFILIDPPFQLP